MVVFLLGVEVVEGDLGEASGGVCYEGAQTEPVSCLEGEAAFSIEVDPWEGICSLVEVGVHGLGVSLQHSPWGEA